MANKLVQGVDEALAIAKGETPAARVRIQGHDYVPATELARVRNATLEEAANIALAIDSGRGNEKEIARAIRALATPAIGEKP